MICTFCEKHSDTILRHPTRRGFSACHQCKRVAVENLNQMLAGLRSRQRYRRLRDMPVKVIQFLSRGRLVTRRTYREAAENA
jgi:hypothetical protein